MIYGRIIYYLTQKKYKRLNMINVITW